MIKFATAPVEGMAVTLTKSVELFGGQEIHAGESGTVRYVFDDTVTVRFEDVVSDISGAVYSDSVGVEVWELPDTFAEFADHEIVDDED
jgi:hypothetical protein